MEDTEYMKFMVYLHEVVEVKLGNRIFELANLLYNTAILNGLGNPYSDILTEEVDEVISKQGFLYMYWKVDEHSLEIEIGKDEYFELFYMNLTTKEGVMLEGTEKYFEALCLVSKVAKECKDVRRSV